MEALSDNTRLVTISATMLVAAVYPISVGDENIIRKYQRFDDFF
jgi:hypothetical protein